MIAFVRGVLRGPLHTGRPASVRIGEDDAMASVPVDPGPLEARDAVLLARTRISIGVTTVDHLVLLGRWEAAPLHGPGGLAGSPVVVLPDRSTLDLARAGLRRAGHRPVVVVERTEDPAIGPRMLHAVANGAEALVIEGGAGPALWIARVLGGRPLAALPLDDPDRVRALFADLDVDTHVPVPTGEDAQRVAVRTLLAPLRLEMLHHLVEVDPTPALDELGVDPAGASLASRATAAAGVLAGRIVVANRRWRAEVDA